MKKFYTLFSFMIIASFFRVLNAQITIDAAGKIGLGTDVPIYPLDFRGTAVFKPNSSSSLFLVLDFSGSYNSMPCFRPGTNNQASLGGSSSAFHDIWLYSGAISISDGRQKENVNNITNALNTVLKLQGVRYDYKKEYSGISPTETNTKIIAKREAERKNKLGFIAQDLNKYIPEAIVYDDSTDIYGVDYTKVIPVLVEAIKEQQILIEQLNKEIKQVKNNQKQDNSDKNTKSAEITDEPVLYQNTPNPFSKTTSIAYYLPESTKLATLYIYDMQGNPKKEISIHDKGRSSITIDGNSLFQGLYLYTLVADGVEVDTKRMILTNK